MDLKTMKAWGFFYSYGIRFQIFSHKTFIFGIFLHGQPILAQCSKPLGGAKFDSAFHPSEVDQMSTRNFWELSGKK